MTKLEQIETEISNLSDQELKQLAAWFDELRWQRWDRQIEEDSSRGRLDSLVAGAMAQAAAGKLKPL